MKKEKTLNIIGFWVLVFVIIPITDKIEKLYEHLKLKICTKTLK